MRRRDFTLALTGAPAYLSAQINTRYEPQILGQCYVWQQQYQKQNQKAEEHIGEIAAAMAGAGYKGLELTSGFLTAENMARTKAAMEKSGLALPSYYQGGPMTDAEGARKSVSDIFGLAKEVRAQFALSAVTVNPEPKPQKQPKSDVELKVQADALGNLGWMLERDGIELLTHFHDPEMADGAREFRYLMKNTEPRYVRCCIDVDWVKQGGQNVMEILQLAGRRIRSVHLRNSKANVWLEDLNDGDVDYSEVARYLREINFNGWLVVELAYKPETKVTRKVEENLRLSRLYAEKVFGVKS